MAEPESPPMPPSSLPHPSDPTPLAAEWLGSGLSYEAVLARQESLQLERKEGRIPDTLLLLEHAAVYTIGRTRDRSSLGPTAHLPHPVVEISRGGQATYHGPGQLIGYPILDLRNHGRDLHLHIRRLEEALIRTLRAWGVTGRRREGLTGVWVEERKIASIGVGVRQWISLHGFALNVTPESLQGFRAITPCGIAGVAMTCLHQETADRPSSEEVGRLFAEIYEQLLRS